MKSEAQPTRLRSPITTHVLDQTVGKAAPGLQVLLELRQSTPTAWTSLGVKVTDDDGRIEDLLPPGSNCQPGIYRLTFQTGAYYQRQGVMTLYPEVCILFEVSPPAQGKAHYHIPLLLSPFGYSTYRGT